MRIVLWILIVLAALYVLFLLIPTCIAFVLSFRRRPGRDFEETDLVGTYYEPYAKEIRAGSRYMKGKSMEEAETCSGGTCLKGRYLDAGSKKTVIFFHGFNTTPFSCFGTVGRYLYENEGFNLLFADQRAHGESGGCFYTMGLRERNDVKSWIRYARKKGANEILLYGVSMGATAIALGADGIKSESVKGIVLDCGFCSPRDQLARTAAERRVPGKLMMHLTRFLGFIFFRGDINERSETHLKNCRIPVFFLHAKTDAVVPVSDSQAAYDACGAPKMKLFTEEGCHTTAFLTGGAKAREMMHSFIQTYFET